MNFSNLGNPLNPLSPLSPMNPANPISPLNPLNPASPLHPDNQVASSPADVFAERYHDFRSDLASVGGSSADAWMQGAGSADVQRPDGNSLKATAQGFALHVVREGFFGPSRAIDYLYDRGTGEIEVQEKSLKGPVREFFSTQPSEEHYLLSPKTHTVRDLP